MMIRDELAVLDGNHSSLQLRCVRPFYSDKHDITRHKRYKALSDFNKKNEFYVENYLEHKLILPQDQEFELYEYEVSPEEAEAAEKEEYSSVD